jgi:PadR family transcriptional regulator, regulatory protein PadR
MRSQNTDVIQGTLDMLILKTLSLEPMHGFGIARRVEQRLSFMSLLDPNLLVAVM